MRKNLFLYLALACFVGLIAIFVFDGYLGIYDTINITAGEREQTVDPDHWYRYRNNPSVQAVWGEERVFFSYEVNNRWFSSYVTPIQASVWQENNKVVDLFSGDKSIGPFDQTTVEWTLDSEHLQSLGFDHGEYTIKIERKGTERKVILGYYLPAPPPYPTKVPPPER
jgi:hypothetical protein